MVSFALSPASIGASSDFVSNKTSLKDAVSTNLVNIKRRVRISNRKIVRYVPQSGLISG